MSFGRQEYQHRFFKDNPPRKKLALYAPASNYVLPPLSYERAQTPAKHTLEASSMPYKWSVGNPGPAMGYHTQDNSRLRT
jgi:hypothetical protein